MPGKDYIVPDLSHSIVTDLGLKVSLIAPINTVKNLKIKMLFLNKLPMKYNSKSGN